MHAPHCGLLIAAQTISQLFPFLFCGLYIWKNCICTKIQSLVRFDILFPQITVLEL